MDTVLRYVTAILGLAGAVMSAVALTGRASPLIGGLLVFSATATGLWRRRNVPGWWRQGSDDRDAAG